MKYVLVIEVLTPRAHQIFHFFFLNKYKCVAVITNTIRCKLTITFINSTSVETVKLIECAYNIEIHSEIRTLTISIIFKDTSYFFKKFKQYNPVASITTTRKKETENIVKFAIRYSTNTSIDNSKLIDIVNNIFVINFLVFSFIYNIIKQFSLFYTLKDNYFPMHVILIL